MKQLSSGSQEVLEPDAIRLADGTVLTKVLNYGWTIGDKADEANFYRDRPWVYSDRTRFGDVPYASYVEYGTGSRFEEESRKIAGEYEATMEKIRTLLNTQPEKLKEYMKLIKNMGGRCGGRRD